MKRPEKKNIERQDETVDLVHDARGDNDYDYGFNDSWDEWEKFLPNFDEIFRLIRHKSKRKLTLIEINDLTYYIHKRLNGEK